jgi:hypothetical protein
MKSNKLEKFAFLSNERWSQKTAFNLSWAKRSESLLDLLSQQKPSNFSELEFIEFGCGPYAPVKSWCESNGLKCIKFDLKKWDDETVQIDLNHVARELVSSDVYVFSGVLEYVHDVDRLLRDSAIKSKYILLSYSFVPAIQIRNETLHSAEIKRRCIADGWKNHFTFAEFIAIINKYAFVRDIELYNKQQMLVMCQAFD